MQTKNNNVAGIAYIVLAMLVFSLQDIAVKWIGGDYSVIEISRVAQRRRIACDTRFVSA